MSYELPAAPVSIGGVLDSAIRLYRDCMRRCWILALFYGVLSGIFGVIWAVYFSKALVPGTKDPWQVFAVLFSPAAIAGFVLASVAFMIFYGALVKIVSAWAKGDTSLSVGSALATGVRRFPGLLVGMLLNGLIVGIGFILLLIPGFYFLGKLQLWMAAMFMDDLSGLESLEASWRVTRGRWWRGAVILTVGFILLYVVALALGAVSGAIAVLSHLALLEKEIINQVFAAISNVVVLPLFVAITVVMYNDFKLRSEGGDLAARMGSLGKA
jgi:hypothetical protein